MRRLLFAAFTAMMICVGCDYHPYYDGQKFRLYQSYTGLIEQDGQHVYVPLVLDDPFIVEIYGGLGKNHSIKVGDQDVISYEYIEGYSKPGVFEDPDVEPTIIDILPKKLGETDITVTDEDTGESILVHMHVCDPYHILEAEYPRNCFADGTLFGFRYGGEDNVLMIGNGIIKSYHYEFTHITEGTYEFVTYKGDLCLEITYPADEDGRPCNGGEDVFMRFRVVERWGGSLNTPESILEGLAMSDLQVRTRAKETSIYKPFYYFEFIDITDDEDPDLGSEDVRMFDAYTTSIHPWIY